jgi:hypothetical protein
LDYLETIRTFLEEVSGIAGNREQDIAEACRHGDIQLELRVIEEQPDSDTLIHKVSIGYVSAKAGVNLEGISLGPVEAQPTEFCRAARIPSAIIHRDGRRYHAPPERVLGAFRHVLEQALVYEQRGKLSILGTDSFNSINFVGGTAVPPAPEAYHTDHTVSRRWKDYLLGTR